MTTYDTAHGQRWVARPVPCLRGIPRLDPRPMRSIEGVAVCDWPQTHSTDATDRPWTEARVSDHAEGETDKMAEKETLTALSPDDIARAERFEQALARIDQANQQFEALIELLRARHATQPEPRPEAVTFSVDPTHFDTIADWMAKNKRSQFLLVAEGRPGLRFVLAED